MGLTTVTTAYAVLAVVADALVAAALVGFAVSRASSAGRDRWTAVRDAVTPFALPGAWLVAALATFGSLYLSEIAGLIPCQLCWFQRIAMYPLILVLGIATLRGELDIARRYFLWLPLVGACISIYHYQLERFPSQPTLSCGLEAPCSVPVVDVWGFVSVPFMALAAFLLIATLLLIGREEPNEIPIA
ncbi:MAG: disulfide bond formation protein B [Candidatus Dormibacteraeota bacterium]|nr:disulfide bond formation protein B [Candidatus Dormibacteraeota bacterium]